MFYLFETQSITGLELTSLVRLTSMKPQGFSCSGLLTTSNTSMYGCHISFHGSGTQTQALLTVLQGLCHLTISPVLILFFSIFEIFKSTEKLKFWYDENLFFFTSSGHIFNFFFFVKKNTDFYFLSSKITDSKMQLLRRVFLTYNCIRPTCA